MFIEDAICQNVLPVNSLVIINRLKDLLKEHKTNSLSEESVKNDPRIKKLFWLMSQQVFGQIGYINLNDLWNELCV